MAIRQDIHNSEIPALCRSCEARHRGVCGALTPEQLVELSRHTTKRKVEPGTVLVSDSDTIDSYANVLAGVVKLTKTLPDGRQQIVGLQFAPDFIGRPFKQESSITAEAATAVRVCAFPKTSLDRMIGQAPELGHRLHLQALNELDEARDWMLTLGRKTAAERVASFLHLIARHGDPEAESEGEISFDLPLTRADIADFLGLTIETVSRQLTKLRKDGLIAVENNRHVTVFDVDKLERRANI
ncbi:CRP/FNR family transcriptional regulator [Aminobacter lissarensis]|uniref:CRP/FNR family transcriptional regulator n=1 Tax=Aminobacter carboxidus TaxID=376165 RepID=A0A8E1WE62_9HYPH|nr:Crp/Fnr family transcriptional regulator [Aminobacter lissarensis]MBB6465926.1 CRP/FNR family transcriptional regulator [Aminobacter lissarensis]